MGMSQRMEVPSIRTLITRRNQRALLIQYMVSHFVVYVQVNLGPIHDSGFMLHIFCLGLLESDTDHGADCGAAVGDLQTEYQRIPSMVECTA